MLKNLLIFTILISANAYCDDLHYPDFEAELRSLETNQIKDEELLMNNADAVTDVVSDEITLGQAATLREKNKVSDKDFEALIDAEKKEQSSKTRTRRVRSR